MRPAFARAASHRHPAVLSEPLEPRRLLAYAAADYFPLAGGNVWDYVGTVDGASTATRVTSTLDNGITSLNLTDQSSATVSSNHYSLDAGVGLKLHAIVVIDDDASAKINFKPGLPLLKGSADAGDVLEIDDVDTSVTVNHDIFGGLKASGTTDGSAQVIGVERVDLREGRFVDALKLSVTLDFDLTGFQTVAWSFRGTYTSTWWLGAGIGMVKSDEAVTYNASARPYGIDERANSTASLTLTASPLLPADLDSLAGGVLTLDGTEGGDRIDITAVPADGQVVVTRGGVVSRAYAQADVGRIDVFTRGGNDVVSVGAGVIGLYVDAGAGNDVVTAGDGPDTLTGGAGKDRLDGGAGNDRVAGNGGHDRLAGNLGDDRVYGGNENDTMEGGSGVDRLWGGSGDDLLAGNGSNDKLFGEDGNDILSGGTQNDLLFGGAGNDQLFGGAGIDTFHLADGAIDTADGGGTETDLIADADEEDLLINI